LRDFVFILLQHLTPQQLLSRLIGRLAECRNAWLKNWFIKKFIDIYGVNMAEAEREDPSTYINFNDFFCRTLKDGMRPLCEAKNQIASPADGAFSQQGQIDKGRIFQAKGRDFSATELLGGDEATAQEFSEGSFATIYLSPKDYHRLHMPLDGTLVSMTHIPGDLFSVNPTTTENVPRLFARNERLACIFETSIGPVALVLVGAMIVASIETVWAGQVAPAGKRIRSERYKDVQDIVLKKGDEMGRFKLGSTIVMLFPKNAIEWKENIEPNAKVRLGEFIATTVSPDDTTNKNQ
jgi:phosphatidylserine decarboxylase